MSLDNLPVEWISLNLGKVVEYGKTAKVEPSQIKDETWVLELEDIEKDSSKILNQISFAERKSKSTKNSFDSGDVLYGKLRPYLNKVVMAPKDGVCTTEIIPLNGNGHVLNKFLFYWIKGNVFQNYVQAVSYGVNMPRLGTNDGLKAPFILVPIAEQQEIVRQLDVMLAQVEQIKARLDAIPALLKKFRQSVLADAVSGKLTEGANCSKWIKSTIGAEFKCIDGDRGKNYPKKEDYQTEGYCLFLSTKNVRKFGFLFDDKVFISKQKHEQLRNGTLERDDLIITTRGTLGHIASYDKNVPFDVVRINSGMLILRKTKQNLLNEFMMLLLASPKFQRIIEEQRTGSAQPQLPAKILKEFEIELPSLDEQKLIVQKVESYFELIEKTEETVQSAQKRVNLLTQSILAKAFSGELTAEWREQHQELITGINSAESLLAKIQAGREASKPAKKTRKKKKV